VADDGPGPPTIEPERMFDPYEALHAAAGQPDSLGIGLDIARRLARLMGGDVTYRLDAGWSVFELTLPSEPPEPGAGDPPGTRLRVA
jgi:signal transduction histidine kinase